MIRERRAGQSLRAARKVLILTSCVSCLSSPVYSALDSAVMFHTKHATVDTAFVRTISFWSWQPIYFSKSGRAVKLNYSYVTFNLFTVDYY